MSNIGFNIRRALVSQPPSMTIKILQQKLVRTTKPEVDTAKPPLPIDKLYGIDTAGIIHTSALRTGNASDFYNFGYAPSVPSVIRRAIEKCPDIGQATFVDIGCGKGLPLAVATEYPFRRVIGVELSPLLCAAARENAARIAAAHPGRTPIEIVEGDATTFEIPSGYVIIYLYNSVYPRFLDKLAERFAAHQARGNKIMVIYYNPAEAKSFDRRASFARYFAASLPFEEDEAAASPFGNVSDSVAIWQGLGEPMFEALPGADAPILRTITAGCSVGAVQRI
jgi:SAM-dependent methyltransferase